jgi:hypothetical protein
MRSLIIELEPMNALRAVMWTDFVHFVKSSSLYGSLSLHSLSLEPVRPEAVLPDRALCLPTFSHFFIVNKTPLSYTHFLIVNKTPLSPHFSSDVL